MAEFDWATSTESLTDWDAVDIAVEMSWLRQHEAAMSDMEEKIDQLPGGWSRFL